MIEECLRSMLALEWRDIKILVIDQSTDDETQRTAEAVARGDPRVAIVHTDSVGVSEARNLAVELATSEVIASADDDCVVEPGWLDALLREFADSRVVGAYGRVVPPGFTSRNGTEIAFKESRGRQVFEGRVPPWHIGHGANRALRRSAVADVGGFDVHLGPGSTFHAAEDLDMACRLLAAGGRLVYRLGCGISQRVAGLAGTAPARARLRYRRRRRLHKVPALRRHPRRTALCDVDLAARHSAAGRGAVEVEKPKADVPGVLPACLPVDRTRSRVAVRYRSPRQGLRERPRAPRFNRAAARASVRTLIRSLR